MAKLTEEDRREVLVVYDQLLTIFKKASKSGLRETDTRRISEQALTKVYRG